MPDTTLDTRKLTLSIAIPTSRRPGSLGRLLKSISEQLDACPEIRKLVHVYVYDNNSMDSTPDVAANAGLGDVMNYVKNPCDIGVGANIMKSYTNTPGDYIWVVGDDDLLLPGSIRECLEIINSIKPAMILNKSNCMVDTFIGEECVFDNYLSFAKKVVGEHPFLLMGYMLITKIVIRTGLFNIDLAKSFPPDEVYSWLYAIMDTTVKDSGAVAFTKEASIDCSCVCPGYEHEVPRYEKELVERLITYYSNYGSWIFGLAGRPDLNAGEVAHRYRIESIAKSTSFSLRKMKEDGVRNFCIYGAGAHTRTLLESGLDFSPLHLVCIMDDDPAKTEIMGIQVIRPAEIDCATVDAVLISSDANEIMMEAKLHNTFPKPIYLIYRNSPIGPCLTW